MKKQKRSASRARVTKSKFALESAASLPRVAKQARNKMSHLWKPGQSGSPEGPASKRVYTIRQLIEYVGMEPKLFDDVRGKPEEIVMFEGVVRKLFAQALSGDTTSIRILLEYYVGRPAAVIQVHSQGHQFISTDDADALHIIEECTVRLRRHVAGRIESSDVALEAGLRRTRASGDSQPS